MRAVIFGMGLLASPVWADEVLFLGAPTAEANGTPDQVVTTLQAFQKTPGGATGRISHVEYQAGFDAEFSVTCAKSQLHLVSSGGRPELPPPPGSGITVIPYPEAADVQFGDGQRGYIDLTAEEGGTAAEIGLKKLQVFNEKLRAGTATAQDWADGETGEIVEWHPQLVAFLALTLLARTCVPHP